VLELLDQYSDAVASLFPFIVTRKGAVSIAVYEDLSRAVVRQQSFSSYAAKLAEARGDEFLRAQILYTQLADQRANTLAQASQAASARGTIMHLFVGQAREEVPSEPANFREVQVR
jgi:hypothetical protein